MKTIAGAVVASAFIIGVLYYYTEQAKSDAIIMTACINAGGSFYISWNWKPVCTLERKSQP